MVVDGLVLSFLKMMTTMVVDGGVNPRKSSAAIREMGTSPLSTWSLCLDSFFLFLQKRIYYQIYQILSSLRAKRAGPKGLSAESARAVTGRRCPHSGEGKDFLTGQPVFIFT